VLHIEGSPYQRGVQHGRLIARLSSTSRPSRECAVTKIRRRPGSRCGC
jgi:hypothetical protein